MVLMDVLEELIDLNLNIIILKQSSPRSIEVKY